MSSARCRCPCQTTAFYQHSNTRSQSDAQQFWRQDLCRRRTTTLEQSAALYQTMWDVIRPVQAVTEDIFIRTVRQRRSVNCFQLHRIEIFLLTYLLTSAEWPALLTASALVRQQSWLQGHVTQDLLFFHSSGGSDSQYSFCLPMEGWLRLNRPGCLVPCRGGLPVLKRSPIQALTEPGVE